MTLPWDKFHGKFGEDRTNEIKDLITAIGTHVDKTHRKLLDIDTITVASGMTVKGYLGRLCIFPSDNDDVLVLHIVVGGKNNAQGRYLETLSMSELWQEKFEMKSCKTYLNKTVSMITNERNVINKSAKKKRRKSEEDEEGEEGEEGKKKMKRGKEAEATASDSEEEDEESDDSDADTDVPDSEEKTGVALAKILSPSPNAKSAKKGTPVKSKNTPAKNTPAKSAKKGTPVKSKNTPAKNTPVKATPVKATEIKKGRGRPKKVEVEDVKETEVKKGRGRPKKVEVEDTKETEIKRGRGRPKKVEDAEPDDTKEDEDAEPDDTKEDEDAENSGGGDRSLMWTLHAIERIKARRHEVQKSSGKRGAVSYDEMFYNTKLLTYSRGDDKLVRIEGVAEFDRNTKMFKVYWETSEEPPLENLTRQEMDTLVANSKILDISGLIEDYIGHTVVTKHGMWPKETMICTTDKYLIPIMIQYDAEFVELEKKVELGDSLVLNGGISGQHISELLQFELVAYDDEAAYIKYMNGYVDSVSLRLETSFTRLERDEYDKVRDTYSLDEINDKLNDEWLVWYEKYHVCEKYSSEFIEYVRLYEKHNEDEECSE